MDTFAPATPRAPTRDNATSEDLTRDGLDFDEQVARDADANPDADFDPDGLAPVTGPEMKAGADILEARFKRWQLWGAIAGGVAMAAGVAGVLYLRQQSQSPKARAKAQVQKIKGKVDQVSLPKIDFSQAHPRRQSHLAARKIDSLPVRQVQKRVAHRVAHLFD